MTTNLKGYFTILHKGLVKACPKEVKKIMNYINDDNTDFVGVRYEYILKSLMFSHQTKEELLNPKMGSLIDSLTSEFLNNTGLSLSVNKIKKLDKNHLVVDDYLYAVEGALGYDPESEKFCFTPNAKKFMESFGDIMWDTDLILMDKVI